MVEELCFSCYVVRRCWLNDTRAFHYLNVASPVLTSLPFCSAQKCLAFSRVFLFPCVNNLAWSTCLRNLSFIVGIIGTSESRRRRPCSKPFSATEVKWFVAAGWTSVDVVKRWGWDYSRVLGSVGVWGGWSDGTASFMLKNHGNGGCNTSTTSGGSCGIVSIVVWLRPLCSWSFSYIWIVWDVIKLAFPRLHVSGMCAVLRSTAL